MITREGKKDGTKEARKEVDLKTTHNKLAEKKNLKNIELHQVSDKTN